MTDVLSYFLLSLGKTTDNQDYEQNDDEGSNTIGPRLPTKDVKFCLILILLFKIVNETI